MESISLRGIANALAFLVRAEAARHVRDVARERYDSDPIKDNAIRLKAYDEIYRTRDALIAGLGVERTQTGRQTHDPR